MILLVLVIAIQYCHGLITEFHACVENHPVIKAFEIANPAENSIVNSNVYYTKTVATVSNIQEFQETNREYTFCIRSFLLRGSNYDSLSEDLSQLPLVFDECNLEVFDEHAVTGYAKHLEVTPNSGPSANQTHLLEVSLFHNTHDLICQCRRLVVCMEVSEDKPLESTETVTFTHKDSLRYESFLDYIAPINDVTLNPVKNINNNNDNNNDNDNDNDNVVRLIIGIKSCAFNVDLRQAIRDTWLWAAQQLSGVHISHYFIIGDSPYFPEFRHHTTAGLNDATSSFNYQNKHAETLSVEDKRHVLNVLLTEQQTYKDTLLSDDIPVEDSYFTLPQKVLQFMNFLYKRKRHHTSSSSGHTESTSFDYVLICDDDVFIDVKELEKLILHRATKRAFYAGEVLEYRNKHVYKPQRDPSHANYLLTSQFPSSVLPPFALGNFYVLSADIVEYLAKNSDTLKSVGTLEDVSMAVWLMSLQVFPVHIPGVCAGLMCLYEDSFFYRASQSSSYTDDRILAMSGLRSSQLFHLLNEKLTLKSDTVQWWSSYRSLINAIAEEDTTLLKPNKIHESTKKIMLVVFTPNTLYMLKSFQRLVVHYLSEIQFEYFIFQTHLLPTDPEVNLQFLIPSYFKRLLNDKQQQVPMSHEEFDSLMTHTENVILVTGILDCGAIVTSVDASNQHTVGSGIVFDDEQSNNVLNFLIATIHPTNVVFVSGEPVDVSRLQVRLSIEHKVKLTVLNTVTDEDWQVKPHLNSNIQVETVYYPNFLSSLDEMSGSDNNPVDLITLLSYVDNRPQKTEGIAYLYHRCDRAHRETFFNLLVERFERFSMDQPIVRALGQCNGHSSLNSAATTARLNSRFTGNYLDEAITQYEPFKFVVAFENSQVKGYMTEKLTNAYLAGAIPIYWGAPDVNNYFDAESMINCNDYTTLNECVERVVEVFMDEDMYNLMWSKLSSAVLKSSHQTQQLNLLM